MEHKFDGTIPELRRRNRLVQSVRCRLGLHQYAPIGWAERMCVWCLRWEENLYKDGQASWKAHRWN